MSDIFIDLIVFSYVFIAFLRNCIFSLILLGFPLFYRHFCDLCIFIDFLGFLWIWLAVLCFGGPPPDNCVLFTWPFAFFEI